MYGLSENWWSSIILRSVTARGRGRQVRPTTALVQTVALAAEEEEPVDLRRQDARVAEVGGQRQVEGHVVKRDAVVAAVHPVHEGEEGDAAQEEDEQYHAAIQFVQPAVLEAELEEINNNTHLVLLPLWSALD